MDPSRPLRAGGTRGPFKKPQKGGDGNSRGHPDSKTPEAPDDFLGIVVRAFHEPDSRGGAHQDRGRTRRGHSRVQRKKGTRRKGKNEDVGNPERQGRGQNNGPFIKTGRAGAGGGRRGGAKGPARGAPRLGTRKTTNGGQGEEEEEGFLEALFFGKGGAEVRGGRVYNFCDIYFYASFIAYIYIFF